MVIGHDTTLLAWSAGVTAAMVPEDVMSFAVKVLTGVVVALVTAFVHAAGKWLFKRWTDQA